MDKKNDQKGLICDKCKCLLESSKVTFEYLGFEFNSDIPKCPKCGQVYISEDTVKGKMADVEMSLEDK